MFVELAGALGLGFQAGVAVGIGPVLPAEHSLQLLILLLELIDNPLLEQRISLIIPIQIPKIILAPTLSLKLLNLLPQQLNLLISNHILLRKRIMVGLKFHRLEIALKLPYAIFTVFYCVFELEYFYLGFAVL